MTVFARHGILVYTIVPGISVRGERCIKINGLVLCKQIAACVLPRAFSTFVSAIDKAVVRRQVKILRSTVAIFAEIVIFFAFTALPSKLYKLRFVVRNCDFLVGHGISRYRANRLAASFFKSIVFTFFVECSGNTVQRCRACIFEVKRHTRVIVFHARPLGVVVSVVYIICRCTIKPFSSNLVNCCPLITIIIILMSAKGKYFSFMGISFIILKNQSIKTTLWIVRLTQRNLKYLTIVNRFAGIKHIPI